MELSRYQVTEGNKDYILSTSLYNDKLRLECQDKNLATSPLYSKDYSLKDLKAFGEIFTLVQTINEAQNELNATIERQEVSITNKGESLDITFNIKISSYVQELIFQLPIKQATSSNYIKSLPNMTSPPLQQISPQVVINQPTYKEINLPQITPADPIGEQEFGYSTRAPEGIYQSQKNEVVKGNFLDHDRINKIEINTNYLKGEHQTILQIINDLKMRIDIIKKQTSEIRNENGNLNMKTLELKKQYKNLIEAEAALMAENDDLRREKHELILKKNELGFYVNEPHTHDNIKEVNIPYDEKRRRPTNVSKREKQFGGGYSSSQQSFKPNSSFPGLNNTPY